MPHDDQPAGHDRRRRYGLDRVSRSPGGKPLITSPGHVTVASLRLLNPSSSGRGLATLMCPGPGAPPTLKRPAAGESGQKNARPPESANSSEGHHAQSANLDESDQRVSLHISVGQVR
jgi:hypothetical protein